MIFRLEQIKKVQDDFILTVESLFLRKGLVYAVSGHNGCGKTSLLNLLAFMSVPGEGEIIFNETCMDYNNEKEILKIRQKIAYLMQDSYLFDMSVYDNIACGLKLRGFSKKYIRIKVEEILSYMALSHLAERNAHLLSRGEAQRVALARVFVLDADVFLLDEPTVNIDKENVKVVEDIILKLKNMHSTVIFTTHSLKQAQKLSDSIILINDGTVKPNIA